MLLHLGGADSRAFGANVAGLAERFRVFRPDRRGHGRTPTWPDRSGLPCSQLAVVPGCSHGLFVDKPELCNRIVTGFLTEDLEPPA